MRGVIVVILAGAALSAGAQDWEVLSGGNDLSGWTPLGGEWSIADGVITGRLAKTPAQMSEQVNVWLMWTKKEYADFEMELEFRTPVPINGGVQFRTQWMPRLPLPEGVNIDDVPKDCYGYQANVETRERTGTGRLVDENGRGTLADTPLDAAKTLKQRDWNRMRVVARGPVIEIYLHDVLANRTEDEMYLKGYFLLQLRADEVAAEVSEIQYRNIRVKDFGREGQWRPLFDGQTLAGWKEWGEEKWTVEDGAIVGRSGPKKSEGYLATKQTWKDFHVRGAFKMLGEGNFGLFYHSTITLRDDGYPVIAGVQGEVEPGYPSKTGWLYESYKRGWLTEPDPKTAAALALRRGEWNEIEIRSQDKHVTTWVNGVRAMDFEDPAPNLFEGSFALQLHTGGVDGITWKDLYVKE
jgi:hypothetical protein